MTSIKVPPLGESIVEATVSRWLKNEGDAVAPGDTLVELETDKITVEVPSVTGGVLKRRFASEGDVVKLDQMLAEVDEQGDGVRAPAAGEKKAASAAATPAPPASPAPKQPASAAAAPPAPAAAAREPQRVSPAAQRLADESGADLSRVSGTGRGGVVSKADVMDARTSTPAQREAPPAPAAPPTPAAPRAPAPMRAPAPGERETREKMSTRRKRIAENLLESQHATAMPMFT